MISIIIILVTISDYAGNMVMSGYYSTISLWVLLMISFYVHCCLQFKLHRLISNYIIGYCTGVRCKKSCTVLNK